MEANKDQFLSALQKAHKDNDAFCMVADLISKHFAMIEHLKKTSLYDVYMYEERFAKNSLEPMRIITFENEKLKREVNNLRKRLGLCKKYKEGKAAARSKFIVDGELSDKKIVIALKQAAFDYEVGAILEVRDTLKEIVNAIDAFENNYE